MKRTFVKIISAFLITALSMQVVAFAASTPPTYEQRVRMLKKPNQTLDISRKSNAKPERPVVDIETKKDSFTFSTDTEAVRREEMVTYEYKDSTEPKDDIFNEIRATVTYVTYEEALIIADFIRDCIRSGWTETPDEIMDIAKAYDEALLEELSDIYNNRREI